MVVGRADCARLRVSPLQPRSHQQTGMLTQLRQSGASPTCETRPKASLSLGDSLQSEAAVRVQPCDGGAGTDAFFRARRRQRHLPRRGVGVLSAAFDGLGAGTGMPLLLGAIGSAWTPWRTELQEKQGW